MRANNGNFNDLIMKVAEKKCLIITPVSVPSKLKKKQKSL